MTEILVEKARGNYEVIIEGENQYNMSSKKIEEIARAWNKEPEMVAQLRAVVKMAEEEQGSKEMLYQDFLEGYGGILRLKAIEELVHYCLDTQPYYVTRPEKLLEKILREGYYEDGFE